MLISIPQLITSEFQNTLRSIKDSEAVLLEIPVKNLHCGNVANMSYCYNYLDQYLDLFLYTKRGQRIGLIITHQLK